MVSKHIRLDCKTSDCTRASHFYFVSFQICKFVLKKFPVPYSDLLVPVICFPCKLADGVQEKIKWITMIQKTYALEHLKACQMKYMDSSNRVLPMIFPSTSPLMSRAKEYCHAAECMEALQNYSEAIRLYKEGRHLEKAINKLQHPWHRQSTLTAAL